MKRSDYISGQKSVYPQSGETWVLRKRPDEVFAHVDMNVTWYDGNKIVAIRKWVADDALSSGNQIGFDFYLYSLGPSIENVEILTEIRP